jgi:RNA 2',3'-cyclic 3'-phosphodiesterase
MGGIHAEAIRATRMAIFFTLVRIRNPIYYLSVMVETNKKGMIRTFIAAPLPDSLKQDVDKLIVIFKPLASGISWVRAANLHFTLRFLGDIDSSTIADLKQTLQTQIGSLSKFNLNLSGLGCFPNLNRPRVVWVAAGGDIDNMKGLASRVEDACRQRGYGPADKPFAPHLTIGRVKFPSGLDKLIECLKTTRFETDPFAVDKVIVYKSELTPRGPIYTSVGEIFLTK